MTDFPRECPGCSKSVAGALSWNFIQKQCYECKPRAEVPKGDVLRTQFIGDALATNKHRNTTNKVYSVPGTKARGRASRELSRTRIV